MKTVKVQITIPDNIMSSIEESMRQNYLKKSDWFRQAAEYYLAYEKQKKESSRSVKKIDLDL